MSMQEFKGVAWLAAVATAAIGCYMVSLRVASERAGLESVESRILVARRDIRALDTELVTRGRVRQLERWNTDVLALTAPTEGQFLTGEVQLASLTAPLMRGGVEVPTPFTPGEPAPVMQAIAPAPDKAATPANGPLVLASYAAPSRPAASPKRAKAAAAKTEVSAPTKVARADLDAPVAKPLRARLFVAGLRGEIGKLAAKEKPAARPAKAKTRA